MLDSMALWRGGCKRQTARRSASHRRYIDRVLVGYLFQWLDARQTWDWRIVAYTLGCAVAATFLCVLRLIRVAEA